MAGAVPCILGLIDPAQSVFICYAHQDNDSSDNRKRWLDRLLQFLKPMVRQENLKVWSDEDIEIGTDWHDSIQSELDVAKAAILLVSPAFLASDYIANNELPVLLKRASDLGVVIMPIIISPCLYERARFKYPDPKKGPKEFLLKSIQSANPPSKTLVEMSQPEQNRVFEKVANELYDLLNFDERPDEETTADVDELSPLQLAKIQREQDDYKAARLYALSRSNQAAIVKGVDALKAEIVRHCAEMNAEGHLNIQYGIHTDQEAACVLTDGQVSISVVWNFTNLLVEDIGYIGVYEFNRRLTLPSERRKLVYHNATPPVRQTRYVPDFSQKRELGWSERDAKKFISTSQLAIECVKAFLNLMEDRKSGVLRAPTLF